MNKVLNLTYASSLTDLCEVNSSFDSGILRIAYSGENRNKSRIDKATFERCLKTIYNCPIVCNYDRETDTLGGHDMEIVRDSDGGLKIVNDTTPVGCIPESAKTFWEEVEEDDGTVHEYLCAEALLWKRQEAYQKIKKDGCIAQSMEITVNDGKMVNGVYEIYDFEFTAFALIGVEPCFESAALEFSKQDFKQQLSEMMLEIKESFSKVNTSAEDDNIHPQNYSMEGGEKVLKDKLDLIAKYGLDAETLDFSIDDISLDELEEKLKEFTAGKSDDNHNDTDGDADSKFALEGNFREELCRALEAEKVQREWGEVTRYWFVDYDKDANEVFCWDSNDWLLYGFAYKIDGDAVIIDFDSKKRKKYEIVDFDEGEQASPFAAVYTILEEKIHSNTDLEAKYQSASDTIASMKSELDTLRQFKADTDAAVAKTERDEVFAQFEDLLGVEAFEALKAEAEKYDIATLEEKCFAIRGRNTAAKFSYDASTKAPKIKVDKTDTTTEPYGGLFRQYGIESE